jgi:S-DNA-T family DNA segregation ATPase FtsK/SpoIIIE
MASKSSKKSKSKKKKQNSHAAALRREAGGLFLVLAALCMLLALMSFEPVDAASGNPSNLIGPAGAFVADALLYVFGVGSFFFNALIWYLGVCMLVGRRVAWKPLEIGGQLLFVVAGATLCHLAFDAMVFGHLPGGLVGEFIGELGRAFVGTVGTAILGCGLLVLSLMMATRMSLGRLVRAFIAWVHRGQAWARHKLAVHREYRQRLKEEREKLLVEKLEDAAKSEAELEATPIVEGEYEFKERFEEEVENKLAARLKKLLPGSKVRRKPSVKEQVTAELERDAGWELGEAPEVEDEPSEITEDGADTDDEESKKSATEPPIEVDDDDVIDMTEEKEPKSTIQGDDADFGPQIVESAGARKARERKEKLEDDGGVLFKPQQKGNYRIPPISFLDYDPNQDAGVDPDELRKMAAQIEQTLSEFKVDGSVVEICPGPVITMFEFSPAPGVRVSKISRLSDDLAMALSAHSVRIVAPIPGKGVVGIEVPNPSREIVYLKEIIADDIFLQDEKMELPLALGVDVEGAGITADLARMPHLLVAGATGAGKSVAVNTMICSLLYKHTPDDVRLIMVDPKMLEFSVYEDIPHLLLPVVTDPKAATVALNWAVQEMEKRYQKLADLGVRNVKGYNTKVEKLTKQAELDQMEGREDTKALRSLGINEKGEPEHTRMPYLVVIIDEFADLMMTAAKEVETAVARLAQKARAAGIHMILATQRPSTDVITGLIKANFPTRMALRVTSKTDSRVILDSNGAENLLGRGDMLFVPPGTSNLKRVHGAYVSEEEIDQVVEFLKDQGDAEYDESILEEEEEEGGIDADWEKDEHYEDAVGLVVDSGQASISMIQRKLRVGYNRAARMVDMMEAEGYVGPADGCKPREVLVNENPF